jgi:hypothetical protein
VQGVLADEFRAGQRLDALGEDRLDLQVGSAVGPCAPLTIIVLLVKILKITVLGAPYAK